VLILRYKLNSAAPLVIQGVPGAKRWAIMGQQSLRSGASLGGCRTRGSARQDYFISYVN
jgi:hypothetical protein